MCVRSRRENAIRRKASKEIISKLMSEGCTGVEHGKMGILKGRVSE
jgi:hypothetical protein